MSDIRKREKEELGVRPPNSQPGPCARPAAIPPHRWSVVAVIVGLLVVAALVIGAVFVADGGSGEPAIPGQESAVLPGVMPSNRLDGQGYSSGGLGFSEAVIPEVVMSGFGYGSGGLGYRSAGSTSAGGRGTFAPE